MAAGGGTQMVEAAQHSLCCRFGKIYVFYVDSDYCAMSGTRVLGMVP